MLFVDVSCPNPGAPRNGIRDGTKFKYGRRVKYSCNTGYKLVGSISRKCMSNGKWSGKRAKCVKIGENIHKVIGVRDGEGGGGRVGREATASHQSVGQILT